MIKKLFEWTQRDIAFWEKVQHKGLLNFIGWYGVIITGGVFFLVFGFVTLISWFRQVSGRPITQTNWVFLAVQLIFVALLCLVAGITNSLITWVVEERLYRKYNST
jgi:hypothetical protein